MCIARPMCLGRGQPHFLIVTVVMAASLQPREHSLVQLLTQATIFAHLSNSCATPYPIPPALTRTMSTLFSHAPAPARNQVWLAEATVSGFCNDRAWTALLNDYFSTRPKLHLRIPPVPSTVGGPISAYCDSIRGDADGDGAGAAVLSHDGDDDDNEGDDDSADVGARSRPPVHAAFRGGSNMSDSTARAALSIDGPHFEFLTRKSHHLLAIGWIISVRQRPPSPMWLKARVLAIYPAHIALEVLGHEGPHGPLNDVGGDSPAKAQ